MQRYFITLSYDGTAYHGWQIQPNGISVQEVLEHALSTILRESIAITGAGRTDAGVHGRMMVAHFDTELSFDCAQLVYKVNRLLPRDVSVSRIEPVCEDLHARFSATSRTYHYYVHTGKQPFSRQYSCELHYSLDFDKMNEAAAYLIGEKDFKCFCKTGADVKTTICNLTEARWIPINDEFALTTDDTVKNWCFVITANRFLRNMVRAVVGTLVEVGRGRLSLDEFKKIGNALFLWEVKY